MKLKRIAALCLSCLMAVSAVSITAGAQAADKVLDFTKVQRGVCDHLDTGTVETVKEDNRGEVVKFTVNPKATKQDYLTIDGHGAVSHGIDVAKYKYMVLEMRFDSDTIEQIKPVVRFLSTTEGTNITGLPYLEAENALVSDGNWYNVVIDMEKGLADKFSGDSVIMNHLQYCIGGREFKAEKFGEGDAIYISKMTLTNSAVDTSKSTGTGSAVTVPTVSAPVYDAEDKVLDYTKMQRGICDHKDTGKVEVVTDSEKGSVVQFTINPAAENQDYITIDGYGADEFGIDIAKYKYMIIDMKFESEEVDEVYPVMRFLSTTEGGINGSPYIKSAEPLTSDGTWQKVVINMYPTLEFATTGKDSVIMRHLQFSCGGRELKAALFGDGDKISVSKITLTNDSPNKDKDFTISFEKSFNAADGDNPASIVGKPGTKYTIPEIPYTSEGYECVGWMMGSDGSTTYAPGMEMTIGEANVKFTAVWKQKLEAKDFIAIDYASYYNGICDHVDTAEGKLSSLGAKPVVEVIPNPATTSTRGEAINLDGWSYGSAKLNLSLYKTIIIEYLYLSDNPVQGNAKFNIMARSNFSGTVYTVSREPIVEGRWAAFSFDMTKAEEKFIDSAEPNIMQAHIYPLGDNSVKKMSANDRIYIGKIIAIPEVSASAAVHESYINGYDNGTFGISGNMTRAEAATIVARLAACGDANVPVDKTTSFTDVPQDQWYHKYISYVESLGYLKSYSGTFAPNQNITRAEFVELVYNMGLLTDAGKNGTFTDVAADHPRAEVISAAGKAGLVNGYANGDGTFSFKPDATITRAEVVKVINNAYGKAPTADGIFESSRNKFSDVTPDHWAYADIIDAAVSHISYVDADGRETWKYVTEMYSAAEDFDANFEEGANVMEETAVLIDKRAQEIKNTPSMDLSAITGKKIYVSESTGDDANDGLSEAKPVKTIAQAQKLAGKGDAILLKRGDMWRERFKTVSGLTYTAYGTGAKPIINANLHGDVADEALWTLVDGTTNIWLYAKDVPDVGNIVVNGNKTIEKFTAGVKYINSQMLVGDTVIGPKVHLKDDNYFVSVYNAVNGDSASLDNSKLYVRCDAGNPGKVYDSIELCYRGHAISAASSVTIDNIAIFYAGSHGVSMGSVSNVKFTNMEIGWIGGAAQNTTGGVMTRFGNGIEVYGSCNNYVIDNCYVYQCYDAGITHQKQWGGGDSCTEENVWFTNNVIDRCIYNIEYFMGIADNPGTTRFMKNINYTGNLLARSGYGWGYAPSRSASVKGWNHHNNHAEDFTIENNVFFMDRVNAADLGVGNVAWLPVFKGNTYIQKYGNTLTKLGANGATQYMMDSTAAYNLEKVIGEENAKLYFVKADTVVE